jgi:predicted TIM-barrel fold metal-dependent hydrolase
MNIINVHSHTFTVDDCPEDFLPLHLVKLLRNKWGRKIFGGILSNLIFWTDKDALDRYKRFIDIGGLGTQKDIFNPLKKTYPDGTKFVILPMNMEHMGAGSTKRPYAEQINELGQLAKEDNSVIPFVMIDPRQDNPYKFFLNAVENLGFKGVKLYPNLGYFPYDHRLDPIYDYCEKHNLPVLVHCSPNNPVFFKGSDKELQKLLEDSKDDVNYYDMNRKRLIHYFGEPMNYEYVVESHPNLRICLAHFGSESEMMKRINDPMDMDNWSAKIDRMIRLYPKNIYTDISFSIENSDIWPQIIIDINTDKIGNNILFGSDYYMNTTEATESKFNVDFRKFIGEDRFKKIAETNNNKFLYNI